MGGGVQTFQHTAEYSAGHSAAGTSISASAVPTVGVGGGGGGRSTQRQKPKWKNMARILRAS